MTVSSRALRLALFFALIGIMQRPVFGACEVGSSFTPYLEPWPPDSQDVVTAGVSGYTTSTCLPSLEDLVVDREGRRLSLSGRRPALGCETTDEWNRYRLEAKVPALEPGNWELVASLVGEDCSEALPFTVRSAGRQGGGGRAAASLLFPYFHLDLEGADGLTTLLAIGNASPEEALAHVVIWTDWGIPTLAFDVHLPGHAVQTINLRDVFRQGRLPVTDPGGAFPGCESPISLPSLGGSELAILRARHTGRPDPDDGLCYGSRRRPPNIATGFVTVDVVRRCPQGLAYPTSSDETYFGPDDTHLAASWNVLYGDLFFVDPGGSHAQAVDAVPVMADGELGKENGIDTSFYRAGMSRGENRVPLPGRYRTRFVSGGSFDGETSLIIWRWTWSLFESAEYGPESCDPSPAWDCMHLYLHFSDEAGDPLVTHAANPREITGIYEIGGDEFPVSVPFGSVQVESLELVSCLQIPAGWAERPAWVIPLASAEGRYSMGWRATPVQ